MQLRLLDSSLIEVILEQNLDVREKLLEAYVTIYLEEEIRAEAIVRESGDFVPFLEIELELIRLIRLYHSRYSLKFWLDSTGPEVDWVIQTSTSFIPNEVKWTDSPTLQNTKHLQLFLSEHPEITKGFIICRTPSRLKLTSQI
jgi:hypothetical protein